MKRNKIQRWLHWLYTDKHKAHLKADEMLSKCVIAFGTKVFSNIGSVEHTIAWEMEKKYSRYHNRYLNLAAGRNPYRK